ncbi:MAG: hypothetical protein B5M53_12080 [Candidatus Cloacimonas sp. 4484_209]|nr:MAG: hypothetical protein B5M53_12080 [Candidatus Cloacimonas sp. 4484_209]
MLLIINKVEMNKEEIEIGIRYGYRSRSISILEALKYQAMKEGYYDLAEEAVRCINALQNPFICYC